MDHNFAYVITRVKKDEERGVWKCTKCDVVADTEHNNEECHQCSDWYGCGGDCTLSKLICPKCGATKDM